MVGDWSTDIYYSFQSFKLVQNVPAVSYAVSIRSFSGRFELLERLELFERLEPFELFLPRLPELQDPFLRFFLARTEFRVGIREAIFDTCNAALLRHYLAKRDVIAQR